ncbi:MAG: hypothetical protein IID44_15345 [Planctomycetes bacterium]|nr:hypothetical protein [Planctomycetota bacterium]
MSDADDPLLDADTRDARKTAWLRRTVALATLALLAVTWKLWTPQTVFPQVPLFGWAIAAPGWIDWGCFGGVILSLLVVLLARQRSRLWKPALLVFVALLAGLIVLDQHRFQPWAYQMGLFALVLATVQPGRAVFLLRMLVISIYFYSAVSKFDHSFLLTLGQQFLDALARLVGRSTQDWPPEVRFYAAMIFPIGELAVGVGFCFRRTRRPALVAAIVMHLLLIVILGPLGLDHKPGVLVWNGYFIAQAMLLFPWRRCPWHRRPACGNRRDAGSTLEHRRDAGATSLLVQATIWLAVALPVLEWVDRFDHWPAWGLYASRAERITVLISPQDVERLDDSLRAYVTEIEDENTAMLHVDRWSLDVLGAPIYPQNRFQIGVAEAVARRWGLNREIQVEQTGPSDRFNSQRERKLLRGLDQLRMEASRYWLNTRPRERFIEAGGDEDVD